MRCRYCHKPCSLRSGKPGYINAHEECHAINFKGESERLVAGRSTDETGSVWEILTESQKRKESRYMPSANHSVLAGAWNSEPKASTGKPRAMWKRKS